MKTNIKVYSNLNLINHDNGQAKQITIYVKNGVIDKISYSPPENGIDFIDCNNAFLIPGFVDGHGHMTHLGKTNLKLICPHVIPKKMQLIKLMSFINKTNH